MGLYASSCPAAVWAPLGDHDGGSLEPAAKELGGLPQQRQRRLSSASAFVSSAEGRLGSLVEEDYPAEILPDDEYYEAHEHTAKDGGGTPGSLTIMGLMEALSRRNTLEEEAIAAAAAPAAEKGSGSAGVAMEAVPQLVAAASENMFQMEEDES